MTKTETGKRFASEAEEAEYWQAHPGEFEAAVADEPAFAVGEVFPELGPSTERLNIRMPAALLARIRQAANARDVPYQSLIKSVLFDAFFSRRALPGGSEAGVPSDLERDARARPSQHVIPHERGWAVRGEGNRRATSVHETQREAIEAARRIAGNQASEVVIHRRDGSVREREKVADSSLSG